MQSRHEEGKKAHLCIETKFFNPLWITLFVILCIVAAIVGSVLTMFVPDQYNFDRISTYNCSDPNEKNFSAGNGCIGHDLLHDPNEVYPFNVNDRKDVKNNLVLMLQPQSLYSSIGVSFEIQFEVNLTLPSKNESKNRTAQFTCQPDQPCSNITLIQYHQNQYEASFRTIFVENSTETSEKTKWVGDLYLIFRSDNNAFYVAFSVYRIVAFVITIVLIVLFIISYCRQESKMSSEQFYTFIFLWAALFLEDPLYLFQMGIKSGAFQVIDSIAQVIAEAFYMLYPLIILSGFVTRKPSVIGFYIPRIALVVLYAALRLGVVIFINVESTYIDPTVTISDFLAFRILRILSSALFLFWILWFLYACARTFVVAKQHPIVILGRFRVLIAILVFFEAGYHGMQVVNVVFPQSMGKVGHIITMWIGSILAIMMGIFFLPTSFERVTRSSVSAAFQPKAGDRKRTSVRGEGDLEDEAAAAEESVAITEGKQRGRLSDGEAEEGLEALRKEEDADLDMELGFSGSYTDRVDE